jgi:hypothetical protein
MKRSRILPIGFTDGGEDEARCPILIVSPDDANPDEGEALHRMTRSEAAALLRLWRINGMPFRDRSPVPILAAIIWRMTEALKIEVGEVEP